MLEPYHIGLILLAILAVAIFSRRIEMSVISIPMIFTAFGWMIGQGGANLVPMDTERETIHLIAEITLILVLFADAARVDLRALLKNPGLPMRMLLIGMPLTILFGTVVAHWVSPDQSWATAFLLAAILTPTDAALGQAVVTRADVPQPLRRAINVESGLNDGLALPVVLIAAIAAVEIAGGRVEGAPDNLASFALLQVSLGPLVGITLGYILARLLDIAIHREWATEVFQSIYFLGTAFLCFVVAEMVGGNSLIAAFVGGLVFGNILECSNHFITEFMEGEGQLLTIFTFLIFGAVMVPAGLEHANWKTAALALAFLTVVRMIPMWFSLTGSGLSTYGKFFLGWFGPRGLASILFALLILESYPVPGAEEMLACVVLTVMLSIMLHGVTANPLSDRFTGGEKTKNNAPD